MKLQAFVLLTVTKLKPKLKLACPLELFHPFVTRTKLQQKPHSHLVYIPWKPWNRDSPLPQQTLFVTFWIIEPSTGNSGIWNKFRSFG